MKLKDLNIEHIFLSMFLGSLITTGMYIITMVLIYYIEGYNMSLEPIGYAVAITYYVVITTTLFLTFKEGE